MSAPDIEDLKAGDAFRKTLLPRADAHNGPAPLWHGWAIMDAFLAGAEYARKANSNPPTVSPSSPHDPAEQGRMSAQTKETP